MSKTNSTKKVAVHPLAIASICDHYTRVQAGGSKFQKNDPVVGLLFGTQSGLYVEVIDGTDAVYALDEHGEIALPFSLDLQNRINFPDPNLPTDDEENKKNKCFLMTEPFKHISYELLGWYTLSDR